MKLTQSNVAKIVPEAGKFESRVFDDTLAGFGVRVWNPKKPKRAWIIQYRRLNGKVTTHKIGPCERISARVARDLAKQKLAQAELAKIGKAPDPGKEHQVARHQASETFETIAARFLQRKQKAVKPSSFGQIQTHLTKHWANFNGRSVHQISRRDIATRLAEIADQRGDYAANRAGGTLSNFFGWLMQEGIVEANPVIGTGRKIERARDRVLSDGELAAIWKACRDDDYGAIIRLLILTGQRRDEVGAMQRDELELTGRKWLIPGNRTKNGRPHEVPLSDAAVAILKAATARPGREEREAVFGDKTDGNGFRGYSKAKAKLDRRIAAEQTKKKVAPWRLHDLRRTAATRMADIGVQPHIIEAALNHISGHKSGVADVYNRSLYSAEKRAALDTWGAHVEAIIAGRPGSNIVTMTKGRS